MSKSICLYFQVHQPTRLRLYRFFDIGKDSHYYDDFANRTILKRVAANCYLPMNKLILDAIKASNGALHVAFSISGSALEQFDRYAPEIIDSFRALADTGCVEFLSETYYHSLAAVGSEAEFANQLLKHKEAIKHYFNQEPKVFRNTELIYSDGIGRMVKGLGFDAVLTEGARHIMGWRSPNFLYSNDIDESQKLLLRNYVLSDDIAFRFGTRGALTSEGFKSKLDAENGDVINLFMDYETFGEHNKADSGIFEFMKALFPLVLSDSQYEFLTPSEVAAKYSAVSSLSVPNPISWADEERDLSAWLGNEMQSDAFSKLYALEEKLAILADPILWADYGHLQESDHFYYMCTKFFSDGDVHKYFNPYDTPYEAFINYMNVLSDFEIRVADALETR